MSDFATFTIRIKNSGTMDATNLVVRAVLSENIEPVETKNGTERKPALYNPAKNLMDFPPIDRLGPRKEIVLSIKVKAKQQGLGTCRTFLRHDDMADNDALEDMAAFKITAPGP